MLPKTAATDSFWREFARHAGLEDADYQVVAFDDNPKTRDALTGLVIVGTKRATASLRRDYGDGKLPLPAVGDFVVVVDSAGEPRCIWRTTEIEIKPLEAVDERFAFDEGEGDRSRDYWLEAHRDYFGRQGAREGFEMHDAIETVFERFTIVWPLAVADNPGEEPRPAG